MIAANDKVLLQDYISRVYIYIMCAPFLYKKKLCLKEQYKGEKNKRKGDYELCCLFKKKNIYFLTSNRSRAYER
jgi:hypothetical protein